MDDPLTNVRRLIALPRRVWALEQPAFQQWLEWSEDGRCFLVKHCKSQPLKERPMCVAAVWRELPPD